MRIVHIQTTIQATFGALDEEGNAIPQQPIVVQAPVFSEAAFAEAFRVIKAQRDKIIAASDGAPEPASEAPKPARKPRSRPKR